MSTLGPKSTAIEALRGHDLTGKTAIVTGGASGIGVETTRVLALAGARVVMAVRNVGAARAVAERLRRELPARAGALEVEALDLADLQSVAAFAERYRASGHSLHLLIENAGIMGMQRPLQSAQGLELQVGTNHLGHVALTAALLPLLSAPARIVVVASNAHRRAHPPRLLASLAGEPIDYSPMGVYGDSKLANILFAKGLASRLPAGVEVFSLHPGVIITPLMVKMGWRGRLFVAGATLFGPLIAKTVAQGAATTIYAATAPELAGQSGAYLRDCQVWTPRPPGVDSVLIDEVWRRSDAALSRAGFPVQWPARA